MAKKKNSMLGFLAVAGAMSVGAAKKTSKSLDKIMKSKFKPNGKMFKKGKR